MPASQPWATGPREILHHALSLLKSDSDTNRRLAMILVDNAVEQMIKTYLNLPKRINGLTVPRAKRDQIAESFPAMLDALEEFAADKLVGVDLGNIEWYHRLRNQLYHEGFGEILSNLDAAAKSPGHEVIRCFLNHKLLFVGVKTSLESALFDFLPPRRLSTISRDAPRRGISIRIRTSTATW